MAITQPVSYSAQLGPEGKEVSLNPNFYRNAINESGETIAFGRLCTLVDPALDSQEQFNPSVRLVDATDTDASRFVLSIYTERNEGVNYQDGPNFLDAQGFRGLPDSFPLLGLLVGEMWVYSEEAITSMLDPVFARHTAGAAPNLNRGRFRISADAALALDISNRFEWVAPTTGPGLARLRFKG